MIKVNIKTEKENIFNTYTYNTDRMLIVDVLKRENLSIETPCGCIGTCAKCLVVAWGDLSDLTESEVKANVSGRQMRMSCTTFIEGEAYIELRSSLHKLNTTENDTTDLVDHTHVYDELSIAFDVGTTGISAELLDCASNLSIRKLSELNPQTVFGNDVLTRICYAVDNTSGTEALQEVVLNCIAKMTLRLLDGVDFKSVSKIYIAGNTTMLHIIGGVNPAPLAKAPYKAVFLSSKTIIIDELACKLPKSEVVLLPSASSYIGADIVAGVYALNMCEIQKGQRQESNESILLIDIGTNGEIIIGGKSNLVGTSTAAGPALEGMSIECGMRAVSGAIDQLEITPSGEIKFSTIDSKKAVGVCGSGLIDLMAQLVVNKIVLSNGRFNKNMDEVFLNRFRNKRFYITDKIYISQKDIRQIQLAKAAISTGVKLLYDKIGKDMSACSKVLIAGSFGYHLSEESIRTIGLIPNQLICPIEFVGNSSLAGARRAVIDTKGIEKLERIGQTIEVLELSRSASFQNVFVSELSF